MTKSKKIILWVIMLIAVVISYLIFPVLSLCSTRVASDLHYYNKTLDVEQCDIGAQYVENSFPWHLDDNHKLDNYNNQAILTDIENNVGAFLGKTLFSGKCPLLNFDNKAELYLGYLFIKNYNIEFDNKQYSLDLSYDIEDGTIIMVRCDFEKSYNRDIISQGELFVKQIISDYKNLYSGFGGNYYLEDIPKPDNLFADYLNQISSVVNEVDVYSFADCSIDFKLYGNNICVCNEKNKIAVIWDPYTNKFVGFGFLDID